MSWQPGHDRISDLITTGELEKVTPDGAIARRLLDDARMHLDSSQAAIKLGDLTGAYQLAYDALRKSAASLLAVQGLRATSRGGHLAVQEAVVAQFGASVRILRSFGRIRRARNTFEYPSTETAGPVYDDVSDAVDVANQAYTAAITIIDEGVLSPWH